MYLLYNIFYLSPPKNTNKNKLEEYKEHIILQPVFVHNKNYEHVLYTLVFYTEILND